MIIALKKEIRKEEREKLISWLESYGVKTHISEGEFQTVIGLVGDTTRIDTDLISGLEIVQSVTRISEPFKKANRKFHPDDTVIRVTDEVAFGGGCFQIIAGPCSVESEDQVETIARAVKKSGGAALSNPGPRRTISRACTGRESGFCWKSSASRACRSSRRLWTLPTSRCSNRWM